MFGLFSSKNRNSQETQNSSTVTDNSIQDYSRTDIYQDYSDNSRTDIWTDNSDNSRVDIWTDNSDNSRVDIWTDNSDNSRVDIYQSGTAAGANVGGNLSIFTTADGAFDVVSETARYMRDTAETAIMQATEQTYIAATVARDSARDAMQSNERVSRDAISGMKATARDSMDSLVFTSRYAIDGVADVAMLSAKTMQQSAEMMATNSERATQTAIDATSQAMKENAKLIQTTALGGQDLMLDAMKKVLLGFAAVAGLGVVVYAAKGAK